MFMVGAQQLYLFFPFHKRHEIGIQSFTLHEANMTYNNEPNMNGCWGQYGARCKRAKGGWLKEIDLRVHSSFESAKTICFGLSNILCLGSALPRCQQGKIGTQSFSYTLPYMILETKKELTVGMVRFHS
jgi:hypothetical protein